MTGLHITSEGSAERPILRLSGELDTRTSARLRTRLGRLVATAQRGTPVVLRLGELDFMDSSGLSALIGAHKMAAARGARLVLAETPPTIVRRLEITGLVQLFELSDPLAE
jgi:anti-sigma B factor antagonist